MKELFLTVFEVSVSVGIVILFLVALGKPIAKRCSFRWKYAVWIVLAVRLLLPVSYRVSDIPFWNVLPERAEEMTLSEVVGFEPAVVGKDALQNLETQGVEPKRQSAQGIFAGLQDMGEEPAGETVGETVGETDWGLWLQRLADLPFLPMVAWVWATVAALLFIWQLSGYFRYRFRLLKGCQTVKTPLLRRQMKEICGELEITRRIPLVCCCGVQSPMMIGLLRPVLVLPMEQCPKESYYILKHELVHWKRCDLLVKLLLLLARDLHWFNPAVWLMQREAVADMEFSCDDAVVKDCSLEQRKRYTETLMSVICGTAGDSPLLSTQFCGGKQILKKRFQNVLCGAEKKHGGWFFAVSVALVLAVGALVGCSTKELPQEEKLEGILGELEDSSRAFVDTLRKEKLAEERMEIMLGLMEEETHAFTDAVLEEKTAEKILSGENQLYYGPVPGLGLGGFGCLKSDGLDLDYRLIFAQERDGGGVTYTVLPDVREGNAAIGKLQEMYLLEVVDVSGDGTDDILAVATYDVNGKRRYDSRVYEADENGFTVNEELTNRLNQRYSDVEEYPVEEIIPLSDESAYRDEEMEEVLERFSEAYFARDEEGMRPYMSQLTSVDKTPVFLEDSSGVESIDDVEILSIKGWEDAVNKGSVGDTCTLSLEFRLPDEDSLTYLTVCFVKEDGWKVSSYGLEK